MHAIVSVSSTNPPEVVHFLEAFTAPKMIPMGAIRNQETHRDSRQTKEDNNAESASLNLQSFLRRPASVSYCVIVAFELIYQRVSKLSLLMKRLMIKRVSNKHC